MTDRSNLSADALRLSRLHEAARLEAQRLRRCAFRQAFEALARALRRVSRGPDAPQRDLRGPDALQRDLRGTGRALPVPSGSARTPPQTSPCAA